MRASAPPSVVATSPWFDLLVLSCFAVGPFIQISSSRRRLLSCVFVRVYLHAHAYTRTLSFAETALTVRTNQK